MFLFSGAELLHVTDVLTSDSHSVEASTAPVTLSVSTPASTPSSANRTRSVILTPYMPYYFYGAQRGAYITAERDQEISRKQPVLYSFVHLTSRFLYRCPLMDFEVPLVWDNSASVGFKSRYIFSPQSLICRRAIKE